MLILARGRIAGLAVFASVLLGAYRTCAAPAGFGIWAGQATGVGASDGIGASASFYHPMGIAVDANGSVWVADSANGTVRCISAGGSVVTVAGQPGTTGSSDGTGAAAQFDGPQAVAASSSGLVYIADTGNSTIRVLASGGVVTTLAGSAGTTGAADGTGAAAQFNQPQGIAVDGLGNVYVADTGNDTIREVTAAGVVTTLAGRAGVPGSADGAGTGALFDAPTGLAFDASGNLYIADTGNHTIRRMTPAGVVTTVAGEAGSPGWTDGAASAAQFASPAAVAVDSGGTVYVADRDDGQVRAIAAGVVSTLTSALTPALAAPGGLAVDGAGNLYVGDTYNDSIRQAPGAAATTLTTAAGPSLAAEEAASSGAGGGASGSTSPSSSASGTTSSSGGSSTGSTTGTTTSSSSSTTASGGGSSSSTGSSGSAGGGTTSATTTPPSGASGIGPAAGYTDVPWVEDAVPAGAEALAGAGGEGWNWVSGSPAPYVGTQSHQSLNAAGLHDHSFNYATTTLTIGANDELFTYVYLNPANPPSEIMLSWNDGSSWEHRAYWGSDSIGYGTDGTVGRVYMGALPATGQWVRLSVPASAVGLSGDTISGMGYSTYDGQATYDYSGDSVPSGASSTTSSTSGASSSTNSSGTTSTGGGSSTGGSTTGSSAGSSPSTTSPTGSSGSTGSTSAGGGSTTAGSTTGGSGSSSTSTTTSPTGAAGSSGSASGSAATPPPSGARLVNLSARGWVGSGEANGLFLGYSVSGSTDEPLLIRAVGPTLAQYGVTDPLSFPQLSIDQSNGSALAEDDSGWAGDSTLGATFVEVGAFALPAASLDEALLATVPSGLYSAVITGGNGSTGVALGEIYEVGAGSATSRLVNLSARAYAGSGNQALIGGFVISGTGSETLLLRGIGPTLAQYGVTGVMNYPVLTVYDSSGTMLQSNSGWGGAAALTQAFAETGAFSLPAQSADAALLITLPPGAYSAEVTPADGNGGIALFEIYEVP